MRSIDKRFLIFLVILSLAGSAVVWLATSAYGAGLIVGCRADHLGRAELR